METINYVSKEVALKKKLIYTRLVHELIRICVNSCDENEIENYSEDLLIKALKCLVSLGGVFFKKQTAPVEPKDFEKIRSSYIAQGKQY